jgi:hypothetical protein
VSEVGGGGVRSKRDAAHDAYGRVNRTDQTALWDMSHTRTRENTMR